MAERGAGGVGTPSPRAPPPYQEGLVGTLADDGVIRAVHGGLAREAGIELADVLLRLLRGGGGTRLPSSELPPPSPFNPIAPQSIPGTRQGLKGGSRRRASSSSQLMCRKKGCFCRRTDVTLRGGGERMGGGGTSLYPYLHIGCISWPPTNTLAGVTLEELQEKGHRGPSCPPPHTHTRGGGG